MKLPGFAKSFLLYIRTPGFYIELKSLCIMYLTTLQQQKKARQLKTYNLEPHKY